MTKKISELAEKEVPPFMQPGFDVATANRKLEIACAEIDEMIGWLEQLPDQEPHENI